MYYVHYVAAMTVHEDQVLPVPPPHVRPSVTDGVSKQEDDLTYKYANIITSSDAYKKVASGRSLRASKESLERALQYHVATLIDNQLPSLQADTHRAGRALKTLRERIVGKEGRVRGNLMGKRVDFSGRSVITGDPNISISEVRALSLLRVSTCTTRRHVCVCPIQLHPCCCVGAVDLRA
jgi:DNA-directed RNA polymerase beta' subunit